MYATTITVPLVETQVNWSRRNTVAKVISPAADPAATHEAHGSRQTHLDLVES